MTRSDKEIQQALTSLRRALHNERKNVYTMRDLNGQIKALEWVLKDAVEPQGDQENITLIQDEV